MKDLVRQTPPRRRELNACLEVMVHATIEKNCEKADDRGLQNIQSFSCEKTAVITKIRNYNSSSALGNPVFALVRRQHENILRLINDVQLLFESFSLQRFLCSDQTYSTGQMKHVSVIYEFITH